MAFRTAFVLCLVLAPCAWAATNRFKRQFPGFGGFGGFGGVDIQGTLDKFNQLAQQAQDLAHTQISSHPNIRNMQKVSQFFQSIPSLGEYLSGFTQEKIQRLTTLVTTNKDFQRDVAELRKGSHGSAAYKDLIDKYLNPNPNAGNVDTTTSQNNQNSSMGGQSSSNVKENMPGWTRGEQAAVQPFFNNPDFQRDYRALQQSNEFLGYDTVGFKHEKEQLIDRYLHGGAGLVVVSLVALVASLVVQRLVMFG